MIKGRRMWMYQAYYFMILLMFSCSCNTVFLAVKERHWLPWLLAAVGIVALAYSVYIFLIESSTYELDHSGAVVITIFGKRYFYSWEEFSHVYVFSDLEPNGSWRKSFLLSKVPIEPKAALKMTRWKLFFHPKTYLLLQHTDAIETEIRDKLPELTLHHRGRQGTPGCFRKVE